MVGPGVLSLLHESMLRASNMKKHAGMEGEEWGRFMELGLVASI